MGTLARPALDNSSRGQTSRHHSTAGRAGVPILQIGLGQVRIRQAGLAVRPVGSRAGFYGGQLRPIKTVCCDNCIGPVDETS